MLAQARSVERHPRYAKGQHPGRWRCTLAPFPASAIVDNENQYLSFTS